MVDAASDDDARVVVAARGLLIVWINAHGTRREHREPLSAADLALGLRILADLLEAGLPVSRALGAFHDLAPKGWHPALPGLRQSIREGRSLATALAEAPVDIPPLVVGIVRAGEAGAGIGPAIRRAAELTEAAADTQAAIRSALAYPAIVAMAGALAVTILITVVLPRFAKILADLGQQLPASTRLVLEISHAAHAALVPATIGGCVIAAVWRAWTQTDAGKRQWHGLLLPLPVLGEVRRGAATARVAHALSALLESGVPIATSLVYAARASGDADILARLSVARERIVGGQTLSAALQGTSAVSSTTINLIRAGEESGRVSAMLAHAATIEQKRVDRIVKTAVRMLEPILLLLFANVVALVAASLLQAIYSVRPSA
ncbi:MAG: type II secretion system F family protein [Gemmatimonadaceae bacterium]